MRTKDITRVRSLLEASLERLENFRRQAMELEKQLKSEKDWYAALVDMLVTLDLFDPGVLQKLLTNQDRSIDLPELSLVAIVPKESGKED